MEKIKKISLILVVLLIVCMYQKSYAVLNCSVSITTDLEVTQGEEFEVSIGINNIQGDRGVFTFGGTVEYDKKLLTCIECSGGNNWSTSYNKETRKFVADRNNGFATKDETVLKLKFKANENVTGKTTISIKKVEVANGKELKSIGDASKTISIKAKETDKKDENENQGGNTIQGGNTNQGNQSGNTIQGGNENQGNQSGNTIQGGNENQGNQSGNTIQGGNENQGSQSGNTNQGGNQGGNSSQANKTNNNKTNTATKKPTTTNKTNTNTSTNNVNNTNSINNAIIESNTIDNTIDNSIIIDEGNTIGNEVDVFSSEDIVKEDAKPHKKNNSFMVIFSIVTIGAIVVIGGVFFARNKPNFKIKFKVDK